jgi:hypothetical protein
MLSLLAYLLYKKEINWSLGLSLGVLPNPPQSLVRPSLEYSSAVWDPRQQQDKQRLEMIQRRAARYVADRYYNTSSVYMLDQLEWPSLESQRTNSRLTMMHKMTKNLTNVDTSDKLIPL